ncbi:MULTISPECIES: ubiquinone biosynthesis accessory factor UbiK [unclassified Pseudoalteromonas]|uniref:ubiquinone biosynthesis accessory factor UbiK n=1 Tax=unclassified Pseudoalteromonas TaxID=194690 RepID=UPI000CF62D16|nr:MULTISPECIES: accessory factor UbiK family protein [unclassified Pseudoalteromonas]
MINPSKIEEIARQIGSNMPKGMRDIAENFENKTKQVLQNKLAEMDFVSREEFDIQSQVLVRTREKLTALEEKVVALEAMLAAQAKDADAE